MTILCATPDTNQFVFPLRRVPLRGLATLDELGGVSPSVLEHSYQLGGICAPPPPPAPMEHTKKRNKSNGFQITFALS